MKKAFNVSVLLLSFMIMAYSAIMFITTFSSFLKNVVMNVAPAGDIVLSAFWEAMITWVFIGVVTFIIMIKSYLKISSK